MKRLGVELFLAVIVLVALAFTIVNDQKVEVVTVEVPGPTSTVTVSSSPVVRTKIVQVAPFSPDETPVPVKTAPPPTKQFVDHGSCANAKAAGEEGPFFRPSERYYYYNDTDDDGEVCE